MPIKVLTFDVFGTLLDYSDCPWIRRYAEEVSLIKQGSKPYRILSEIFEEIEADWKKLKVKSNVVECLNRLSHKFSIVSLSNADSKLTLEIADYFNLPWTFYVTTEDAKCYKSDPGFYHHASKTLIENGLIEHNNEICHVAAHPYDLLGAQRAGFQTAFIDWDNDPLTSPAIFTLTTPDILSMTDALKR